jgi:hypothetical protein
MPKHSRTSSSSTTTRRRSGKASTSKLSSSSSSSSTGSASQRCIANYMRKYSHGGLHTGRGGTRVVTDKSQALAIAYDECRGGLARRG